MRNGRTVNYHTPDGIEHWHRACGWETYNDAARALSTPIRSFFRWKAKGLPAGAHGGLVAERMARIQKQREKRKR